MILVAVFLDNIDGKAATEFRKNKGNNKFCSTFLATFSLLRDKRLIMLIPLTMYSGFEQSFLAGEYTKVSRSENKMTSILYNQTAVVKFPPKFQPRKAGVYSHWSLNKLLISTPLLSVDAL